MTEHTAMTLESLELLFSAQAKISRSSPPLHSRTLPQRPPSEVHHHLDPRPCSITSLSAWQTVPSSFAVHDRAFSTSANTSHTRRRSQPTPPVMKMTETDDLPTESPQASLLRDRRIPRDVRSFIATTISTRNDRIRFRDLVRFPAPKPST